MAVLSAEARTAIWQEYGSEISVARESVGNINKHELKAAIDAIDNWVDANAAVFNAAIPQPARGALTSSQKARLLSMVVLRRYKDGV